MSETTQAAPKAKKSVALSGVPAGNTALCTVGRSGNDLHYRGYDILDVADTCEFEEIAYLLVHGALPTRAELAVANAHPLGAKPFGRDDYINKFQILTDGIISTRESNRFLEAAQDLPRLPAGDLHRLNVALPAGSLTVGKPGLF